jgi:hypothetical protein
MASTSPWPLIHAEREALIADLGPLTGEQWATRSLRATDTGWSTGSGPEVAGPHLSLILAMTGRSAALAGLSGAGVDTLRSRS